MKVERLRCALGGLLLVGVLGLGQGPAGAQGGDPPAPAADRRSVPTDAALTVTIHEPQRHTLVPAGTPVPVTGTVTAAPVPVNYIYVIDVSAGTGLFGGDCGDQNADDVPDTILDCEIAGLIALHSANLDDGADVSLVTFDSSASVVDLTTTDVVDALRALRTSGAPASFDSPLSAVQSLLVPGEINVVVFVSDGQSEGDTGPTTGPGSPLQALVDAGATILTFAVDPSVSGECTAGPLRTMADESGGGCVEVADPGAMAVDLSPSLAVSQVEIEVNGAVTVASLDRSSAEFSHTISSGLLRLGRNDIIVRAYGLGGEVAEDRTFVVVKATAPK